MATLKDVAQKSGVTVTTVSRVLNNRGYISEQTRQKVYNAIKELNYQPNELARSLTKKRTNIIGVITPSIMHPFFGKVINYLEQFAVENKYKIMLCNSYHQKDKEIEYIEMLKSNKVAGIVLCSRTIDIDSFLDLSLPVVTIERYVGSGISVVECDNYMGGELATKHLINCGCKNIIHISGIKDIHMPADNRNVAFVDVCKKYNINHKVFHTEEEQFQSMDYSEFIQKIFSENYNIDGVFASSDVIAAQVIQVCNKNNIKIPDDLKLVGFDDTDIAYLTTPMLTTIKQPVEQMCQHAIDIIIKSLEKKVVPLKITLPVSLIKRGST